MPYPAPGSGVTPALHAGLRPFAVQRATRKLHDIGQRLWLDSLTDDRQDGGTLAGHIEERSVTGITSNAATFDHTFTHGLATDGGARHHAHNGASNDALFTDLALEELRQAADQLRPIFVATDGQDGWVSMEVSPLLADDSAGTVDAALRIFNLAARPNLFIKIPGTPAGLVAIEEAIFEGIPVNVTMLFSSEQYLAAAGAYYRGIARRVRLGLHPKVASVASVFVNRWDSAIDQDLPPRLRHRLGIAMSGRIYRTYLDVLASYRWSELQDKGARAQRLLWASTGSQSDAPDTLYIEALAAPQTIVAMPEDTLLAFADHGQITDVMRTDGRDAETLLAQFALAGVDLDALAKHLQRDCVQSFVMSWHRLMVRLSSMRTPAPHGHHPAG